MNCCSLPLAAPAAGKNVEEIEIADQVFYGDIVTVAGDDSSLWAQEAVAVQNGIILAVGTKNDISRYVKEGMTEVHQLTGTQTMMPGFIDQHVHWGMASLSFHGSLDMFGFTPTTLQDILDMVRAAAETTPEGEWIIGSGLNPMLVPGVRIPYKEDLDKISTKHPIFILAASMHSAYANTPALTLAGIEKGKPEKDPPGGYIMRDENGEPTGELKEAGAMQMVLAVATMVKDDDMAFSILKQSLNRYAQKGVTTFADAGFFDCWENSKAHMKSIAKSQTCPVRLVAYNDTLPDEADRGVPGQDNMVFMGQKFIADGSPFTATVATTDPYLDNDYARDKLGFPPQPPVNNGLLNYPGDQLLNLMRPVHQGGWQIVCHAQGERAIDQMMNSVETLQGEMRRDDHRYTIEHSTLITTSQIARAKQLGIQLTFLTPQVYWFGYYYKQYIFGEDRATRYHPINSAFKAGIKASFHNDEPCTPTDPLGSMCTAVNRRMREQAPVKPDFEGVESEVLGEEERITVDQAIQACTINPAYQIFHDHLIGSIEKGKIADFVVLRENPRKVAKSRIRFIEVVCTFRGGRKPTLYNV